MAGKHAQDRPRSSALNQSTGMTGIPIVSQSPRTTIAAQSPPTSTTPPHAPTDSPPQTLPSKLNAGDRHWKIKTALLTILIIIDIIGIGCLGWAVATSHTTYNNSYFLSYPLIPLCVSLLWCTVCILFFLIRKRPVHPGARVALDLLLWLTFILTGLITLYSVVRTMNWGEGGRIWGLDYEYGFYSNDEGYELAENGTWVWNSHLNPYSSSADAVERACDGNQSWAMTGFADCVEEDAYINRLWREKPHRVSVEMTGLVCQFCVLVLHFVLFVWACVETHRRNKRGVSKDAEKLAAEIVLRMVRDGAVVPTPGQAPSMAGQAFYVPQGHPQQMYPQQVHPHQTIPHSTNPSTHGVEAPRYA